AGAEIRGFVERQDVAAGAEEGNLNPTPAVWSHGVTAPGKEPAARLKDRAWGSAEILVDPSHIVGAIVQSVPLLPKISPGMRAAMAELDPIILSAKRIRRRK